MYFIYLPQNTGSSIKSFMLQLSFSNKELSLDLHICINVNNFSFEIILVGVQLFSTTCSRGYFRLHMLIICMKQIVACCFFRICPCDAKNWSKSTSLESWITLCLWWLWNADPDRPKNDKATILCDTIQLLKDLISQVSKLKDEYAMLNEESREVMFSLLALMKTLLGIKIIKEIIYLSFIFLVDSGEKWSQGREGIS